MNWIDQHISGVILCTGFFILYGLESMIPLVQKRSRHLISNLSLATILILLNFLFASSTLLVGKWVHENNYGLFNQLKVDTWLQIFISIIFLDLWAGYFVHYLFHKFSWLWKFHSLHHSDDLVDVTTTFRQHPVESLIRIFFNLSGMMILGISVWILLLYLTLSTIIAQIEHANIRIPTKVDQWLQHIIVTPNMHKVHHSKFQHETDSNYSNIFSFWDKIFSTYKTRLNYSTIQYGLDYLDARKPLTIFELLKFPFRKFQNRKSRFMLLMKLKKSIHRGRPCHDCLSIKKYKRHEKYF